MINKLTIFLVCLSSSLALPANGPNFGANNVAVTYEEFLINDSLLESFLKDESFKDQILSIINKIKELYVKFNQGTPLENWPDQIDIVTMNNIKNVEFEARLKVLLQDFFEVYNSNLIKTGNRDKIKVNAEDLDLFRVIKNPRFMLTLSTLIQRFKPASYDYQAFIDEEILQQFIIQDKAFAQEFKSIIYQIFQLYKRVSFGINDLYESPTNLKLYTKQFTGNPEFVQQFQELLKDLIIRYNLMVIATGVGSQRNSQIDVEMLASDNHFILFLYHNLLAQELLEKINLELLLKNPKTREEVEKIIQQIWELYNTAGASIHVTVSEILTNFSKYTLNFQNNPNFAGPYTNILEKLLVLYNSESDSKIDINKVNLNGLLNSQSFIHFITSQLSALSERSTPVQKIDVEIFKTYPQMFEAVFRQFWNLYRQMWTEEVGVTLEFEMLFKDIAKFVSYTQRYMENFKFSARFSELLQQLFVQYNLVSVQKVNVNIGFEVLFNNYEFVNAFADILGHFQVEEIFVPTTSAIPITVDPQTEEMSKNQARNAKYHFESEVDDKIEGNYQQKSETRLNGVVTGQYSYDDGNIYRTIHYIADKDGFRITKAVDSPPHMKPLSGQARVLNRYDDSNYKYNISNNDIACYKKAIKKLL